MKDQEVKVKLSEVLCRVLEQVTFAFSEPVSDTGKVDPAAEPFIEVTLKYWGASSGRVLLILPLSLSRQLGASMLGLDPDADDSADTQADAAKEIGNIMTGQMLTAVYGPRAVFNMEAPVVRELTAEEFFSILDGHQYVCNMVEGRPVIAVFVEAEGVHERQSTHR
ncbi:MAG: hypothetical protein HY851_06375 [candidate division Zixibacteria bacterium]|nr:hypothetical protein [candidate division Zixibacteria bacterium]